MKSAEKIAYMHGLFGIAEGRCKECSNFQRWEAGNKIVRKCRLYGTSHSETTDWNASFQACGMFNVPPDGVGNLYLRNRRYHPPAEDGPLPGQMEMRIDTI